MKQAEQGELLFVNLFAPDPQPRVLSLPFFLVLGNLARLTGLPLILALHVGRVACGGLLLVTARLLEKRLTPERPWQLSRFAPGLVEFSLSTPDI